YSALAGIHVGPRDDAARARFRFCCALNPALSETGRGVLPEYIEERTLPAIEVRHLKFDDLLRILEMNLAPPRAFLDAFEKWYKRESRKDISARQALTLMRYTMSLAAGKSGEEDGALARAEPMILRTAGTSATEGSQDKPGGVQSGEGAAEP